ncbi:hypothetical protein E2C01_007598 [Portunus trituberculatus]|uniref:Uncharacterized protein n=1 Tax=Portunus trituberculatus TaxID=210409 RepID=A0A5B7CYL0_PORTR|nr:hypothetical protein [Portunus trituberculatus]
MMIEQNVEKKLNVTKQLEKTRLVLALLALHLARASGEYLYFDLTMTSGDSAQQVDERLFCAWWLKKLG